MAGKKNAGILGMPGLIKLKLYPVLIHAVKAANPRLDLSGFPKTGRQLMTRLGKISQLQAILARGEPELHGYRIEVSFKGRWQARYGYAVDLCSLRGLRRYVGIDWIV